MADLDVARLQAELRELEGQRREVNERLRQTAPVRGPPPRGPPGPPGPWDRPRRPHDAPPPYRGPPGLDPRGQHDYRDEGPPPARRPGLSSVVAPVEGSEGGDRSSERYSYGDERSEGGRSEGSRKRPAPGGALLEENVDVKRRNKRLFGAILGTLQRFSKEEQALRSTEAAQRRAELERRAAEKKEEEARQLRQAARDEARQMREGEVTRKRQISAAAACKRLEILYATRLARADKLCSRFLLTKTPAPVYWCPAKPSKETEALAEAQREENVAWKAAQLEQLEREKEQLMAQLTAPRRRPGEGAPAGEASGEQPMEGEEDEEGGEEDAMEAEAADGGGAEEQQQQDEGEGGALEEQLQPPVLEGEEEAGGSMAVAADD